MPNFLFLDSTSIWFPLPIPLAYFSNQLAVNELRQYSAGSTIGYRFGLFSKLKGVPREALSCVVFARRRLGC